MAGVVEIAAHVGEEAEAARLGGEEAEIGVGLGRGDRGAELHVVDPERVQGSGDRELLLLREVGERELLALAEGGIDDVELADGVHGVVVVASVWWTCYVGTKERAPEGPLRFGVSAELASSSAPHPDAKEPAPGERAALFWRRWWLALGED